MKTALLLFLSLFCTTQICFSQAYRPFLVDGAHWSISESQCTGYCDPANPYAAGNCFSENSYDLKLGVDTIVGGRTYKELIQANYETSYQYIGPGQTVPCWGPLRGQCKMVGLLWEDTAARKVFMRQVSQPYAHWCIADSILFDFSKAIGDTMRWPGSCSDTLFVVDSINYSSPNFSLSPTLQPLKTWYLRDVSVMARFGNFQLYESVGASVGFFGGYPSFEGPYTSRMIKYTVGSDSLAGFTCDINLSVANSFISLPAISLHPNPTKDNLTLTIQNSSPSDNLTFSLTNLLGQTVQTTKITQAQTELYIGQLPKGIYLWHLLDGGNPLHSGKVIHE